MCNFFSCIVTRDGRVLFTELDSHETIISRAGLRDNHMANFVRLEVLPPFTECTVDEREIPAWFEESAEEYKDRAVQLAIKVNGLKEEYEKIRQFALEEYQKIKQPAWEKYENTLQPALEEYRKIQQPALEEYQKIEQIAWEEYKKIRQPAWEEYLRSLSKIEGYLA